MVRQAGSSAIQIGRGAAAMTAASLSASGPGPEWASSMRAACASLDWKIPLMSRTPVKIKAEMTKPSTSFGMRCSGRSRSRNATSTYRPRAAINTRLMDTRIHANGHRAERWTRNATIAAAICSSTERRMTERFSTGGHFLACYRQVPWPGKCRSDVGPAPGFRPDDDLPDGRHHLILIRLGEARPKGQAHEALAAPFRMGQAILGQMRGVRGIEVPVPGMDV